MIQKNILLKLWNIISIFSHPKSPAVIYKNPYPFFSQIYVRIYNQWIKILSPKKVKCIICKKKNYDFGKMSAISINYIGNHYVCVSCGCNARTRTGLYCLRKVLPKQFSMLDIGAVNTTKTFFKQYDCDYKTLNKFGEADYKNDILDMKIPDNTFDFIMCIHVLEHIDQDIKAMKEIWRVLKEKGKALIMVPQEPIAKTKKTNIEMFKGYGHIWLYGQDFRQRLESAKFEVTEMKCVNEQKISRYGLLKDTVYIATKKKNSR